MTLLIAGLIVFLGIHSLAIFAPGVRNGAVARLGEGPWKGIYGLIALAGLWMLLDGFGIARQTSAMLYVPPHWARHVTFLFMLPVFPLLIATYLPGRIAMAAKHPMLLAVKCWAFGHLLANGSVADVLLFGGFLAWAVMDRISLKRRAPTSPPRSAPRTGRPGRFNDLIAVVLGLGLYVFFILWAHLHLFGVSPLG